MTGLAQSGPGFSAEQLALFTPLIERVTKVEHHRVTKVERHAASAGVLEFLDPGGAPSDQLAFEIFDRHETARGS